MGFIADKLLLYLGGSRFMARVDEKTLTKAMGFKGVFSMGADITFWGPGTLAKASRKMLGPFF